MELLHVRHVSDRRARLNAKNAGSTNGLPCIVASSQSMTVVTGSTVTDDRSAATAGTVARCAVR